MSIPAWNVAGFIPPIRPGTDGASTDRSPYECNIIDVIMTFGFSPERRRILRGLLQYRKLLYSCGIVDATQWLDGSFMEDVEFNESRSPNDIDVVTCFHLPSGHSQLTFLQQYGRLFNKKLMKRAFKVDSYYIPLGGPTSALSIKGTNYWYSMWSHTRVQTWKGFVEVALDNDLDEDAMEFLTQLDGGGDVA